MEALEKLLRDLGVLEAHVVQLTAQGSALTTFEVDSLWVSRAWRRGGARPGEQRLAVPNDVGRKRNIALAAAVAICAGTVLFLDDDIFPGDDVPGGLRGTPGPSTAYALAPLSGRQGRARCGPSAGRPSSSTTTPSCSASVRRWDFLRRSSSVAVRSW